jgi:hypothetical protein
MIRSLWKTLGACGAAMALATGAAGAELGQNGQTFTYTIGLWGDVPYSDVQATTGVPNLIADMNASDIVFSVNDGDLKAGSGTPDSKTPSACSNELYAQSLQYLSALVKPAMFTPGDNDWTDCDRPANGGFNSRERLDYERNLFFSTPNSQGKQTMAQEVQSSPQCLGAGGPAACIENRRWTYMGVTYATLNIQGSCNNLCDTDPDPEEYTARNAADIVWLRDTFAQARNSGSSAIMLISQADPGFDAANTAGQPTRDPKTLDESDGQPDGFKDFLIALRNETIDFRKPVAYVHGDTHYLRVDKPLLDDQGRRLENFTRVETFGRMSKNP